MIFYYNPDGIGDVLITYLKDGDEPKIEEKGPIVRISDRASGEVLGYNFFNVTRLLSFVLEKGMNRPNQTLIDRLNQELTEAGFQDRLPKENEPLIVTGYVKKMKKHPDSDHMHVCQVDIGREELQIVCGAPNIDEGQKVVVARVGALMPDGMIIRPTVLRGVASDGMICSARELGLPGAPKRRGILILDPGTEAGEDFLSLRDQKD
ncbi:DUF4479 domain-containing protein [Sporolactobacillus sp. THM7-7]|nr:DUF4479 domain-containing protein [Sporolactobacillus sp. THM7-7]